MKSKSISSRLKIPFGIEALISWTTESESWVEARWQHWRIIKRESMNTKDFIGADQGLVVTGRVSNENWI